MTPELVIWVLIAGLIGLVWVFTCTILTDDRTNRAGHSDEETKPEEASGNTSRGRVAA
jgi:hypothetical protein